MKKDYKKLKKIYADDPEMLRSILEQERTELLSEIASHKTKGIELIKGDKGDKGDTGEQGEQGIQGVQGIQGDKGAKGDRGFNGKDGKDGLKGDKGDNGKNGIDSTPSLESIIKELKDKKLLEVKDIKGARISMGDMRWHGGGLTDISGLLLAGLGIGITGAGTSASPYSIAVTSQANWTETNSALPSFIKNLYVTQVGSANFGGNLTATSPEVNWVEIASGANNVNNLILFNTLPYDDIILAPDLTTTVTILGTGNIFLNNNAERITLDGSRREYISVRWDAIQNAYIQTGGKMYGGNTTINIGGRFGTAFTGAGNAIYGVDAFKSATSSNLNSVFGYNAGGNVVSVNSISVFGANAGQALTSNNACFFGYNAGLGVTSGVQNSFFGYASGSSITTASRNSYFGYEAGKNATANDNTLFGNQAGITITTGIRNTIIGSLADAALLGTNDAIAIGYTSVAGAHQFVAGSNASDILNVFFGNGAVAPASTNGTTYTINGSGAGGTTADLSGGNVIIAGGLNTGANSTGGNIIFKTGITAGSSTTPQTLATVMTIKSFMQLINIPLLNYATDAAAGAAGLVTGDVYQTTGVIMIKQ